MPHRATLLSKLREQYTNERRRLLSIRNAQAAILNEQIAELDAKIQEVIDAENEP